MTKTFIALAVSATMFPENGEIRMRSISPETVRDVIARGVESALNPSHASTIDVIQRRYGIELPIPERAPKVSLSAGDSLIIVQANLPRLAEGEVHGNETVANAPISFRLWTIV